MRLAAAALVTAIGCGAEPKPSAALDEPRPMARADAPVATPAPDGPTSGETLAIPLGTGTAYRFKGLAVDAARDIAYLGSWDRRAILAVDLARRTHRVVATKYNGKLNGMGVHLRGDTLYAVMNEVDDAPGARALSVLLVIDARALELARSYELRARGARHHFNHVVVDERGRAYITDTLHASVHTVDTTRAGAAIELLVKHDDLELLHGIDLVGARLAMTSYRGGIRFYDLEQRRFTAYADRATAGSDGLAYHDGALYTAGQNTVTRHALTTARDGVARSEVLIADHERFNDPRCVHVAGGWLYVLANIEHGAVAFGGGRSGRAQTDSYLIKYRL